MTDPDILAGVRAALGDVAPDLAVDSIDAGTDLRNDLDIDSMDFLNFVIAVSQKFGVEIPEADYGRITSLAACADYVREHRS